jgi:tRNA-dihydrouridine synthase 3
LREQDEAESKPKAIASQNSIIVAEPEQMNVDAEPNPSPEAHPTNIISKRTGDPSPIMSQADTPDAPPRFSEKKRLHWSGKTCKSGYMCASRVADGS